jgi:hypothetical protein
MLRAALHRRRGHHIFKISPRIDHQITFASDDVLDGIVTSHTSLFRSLDAWMPALLKVGALENAFAIARPQG